MITHNDNIIKLCNKLNTTFIPCTADKQSASFQFLLSQYIQGNTSMGKMIKNVNILHFWPLVSTAADDTKIQIILLCILIGYISVQF